MDHCHAVDREFLMKLRTDFPHLGQRHRFVGFVLEVLRRAAMGFVADEAIEGDGSAILVRAHELQKRSTVDRRVHKLKDVFPAQCGHGCRASASTHRRQEGNLIIGGEARIPRGEFLITGSDQRSTKASELRVARHVFLEQIGERRSFGYFCGFLGKASELPDATEEEHFQVKTWRDVGHKKIVT
jgi:hypothetical protein